MAITELTADDLAKRDVRHAAERDATEWTRARHGTKARQSPAAAASRCRKEFTKLKPIAMEHGVRMNYGRRAHQVTFKTNGFHLGAYFPSNSWLWIKGTGRLAGSLEAALNMVLEEINNQLTA